MLGKLSHGSLPADAVAGVLGSVDGYRRSVSGHRAQTGQVQDFDIRLISAFKGKGKRRNLASLQQLQSHTVLVMSKLKSNQLRAIVKQNLFVIRASLCCK